MNFELSNEQVRVENVNLRAESHGDEEKPAVDVKLKWQTSNEALAKFHPALRETLYRGAGIEPVLPTRVFPDMGPLKWKDEATGMRFVIDHGLGGKSDLVLDDCTVDNFVLTPLEGGTVEIVFRVRALCADEHVLGSLGMLLHATLPVTLAPAHPVVAGGSEPVIPITAGKRSARAQIQEAFINT